MTITRRDALIAGGGATAVVAAGIAVRFLLRRRYAPSPYDDLLSLVENRDAAAQLGETVLADQAAFEPEQTALQLRKHIAGRPLAIVTADDVAQGHVAEAGGWVLPETLALICALAAKAAA